MNTAIDVEFDDAEEIVLESASHQLAETRQAALPVQAQQASPAQTAIELVRSGMPVETLREIMQLEEDWRRARARDAYTAAMAEFKANPPTIIKNKRVGFDHKDGRGRTEYNHATLDECVAKIVPALAAVGISHSWIPSRDKDRIFIKCRLTHRLGHFEEVEMDGPPDTSGNKNPLQQIQSTRTSLERYTLLAITGLAAKDTDDDGRGGAADGEPPVGAGGEIKMVTPYQAKTINHLLSRATDATREWFYGRYGSSSGESVPASQFDKVCAALKKANDKSAGETDAT